MTAPECIFRCDHCGATEIYDESRGFYLVAWWAESRAFEEKHRDCQREAAQSDGGGR